MTHIITKFRYIAIPLAALLLTACGLGSERDPGEAIARYSVSGAVSGLTGSVVLQNNGSDNITVAADGSFTFTGQFSSGSTYAVSVLTQPSEQTCSVSTGAGTVSGGNVSNVTVTCSTNAYTVGGSVSGLTGTVVLQNNNGDNLSITANGAYTFATPVAYNSPYSVTVLTQPTGMSCSIANGTGTIAATNVSNVTLTCTTNAYTVGGSVSGLTGTIVLQNNSGDNLSVSANGNYTFPAAVAHGSTYAVTILTQPANQTCSVSTGAGTVSGNSINNVAVTCSVNTYTVGGSVSGLTGTVVLQNNNGDNLSITANGAYTFATPVAYNSPYSVTVLTQPTGMSCSIANGTGTIAATNVSNVTLTCAYNIHTVGGVISGLNGSMVLQNNGADDLTVATNGAFTFPTAITYNNLYNVTLLSQQFPDQDCVIINGNSAVTGNVSNVVVNCTMPPQVGYNVTIVATGASSGGAWVGNTWTASAENATVLASEIETHLLNGSTTINNWSGGGTQNGDMTVSGAVSWGTNTLTLSAARHVTINATMTATTGVARLALEYGQGAVAAGNHGMYRINTPVDLKSNPTFRTDLVFPPVDPLTPLATYPEPSNLDIYYSLKRGSDGTVSNRSVPYCPVSQRGKGFVFNGCSFLKDTVTLFTMDIRHQTVEHNVAADTTLWIYINENSQFIDAYYPYAMACLPDPGTFYYPGSDLQAGDIGPGGAITTTWAILESHTSLIETCKKWYQGPVHTFFDSSRFPNGYYIKFVPKAGESGDSYNFVSLLITELATGNTSYTIVDHIINVIPDTAPDAFAFTDQTNVVLSTPTQSNAITVTGITNTAAISVIGGEYQINGGAWTSTAGTANKNDTVKVRHTSSVTTGTMTHTVLIIGSGSDTFSTTTN